MRHTYALSNSTIKVLTNRTEAIAQEMDLDPVNLRQMLNGTVTDRFSSFRHLYAGAVRADAPVEFWDMELAAIRAKHQKPQPVESLAKCLTKILQTNAETTSRMATALEDGIVDDREAINILRAVAKEREVLDLIETRLQLLEV